MTSPVAPSERSHIDVLVTLALLCTLIPAYSTLWDPLSGGLFASPLFLSLLLFATGSFAAFLTGYRVSLIAVLVIVTVGQNVIIGLFIRPDTSAAAVWFALGYKSIILAIIAVVTLLGTAITARHRFAIRREEIPLVVFAVGLFVAMLNTGITGGFSQLGNIRNFASLLMLYAVGRACVVSPLDLRRLEKFLIALAIAICIFGIYERFFFDIDEWVGRLHIDRITEAKFQLLYVDPTNLDIAAPSWYTSYLGIIEGRRMASFVADPVNLSATLAALFILAFHTRRLLVAALVGLCLFLTLGKAAHVGVASAIWIAARSTRVSARRAVVETLVAITCLAIVMVAYDIFGAIHIQGLVGAISESLSKPLGHGIGAGGNLAQITGSVDEVEWINSGGESGFGVSLHQLGIIAFALPWFVYRYLSAAHVRQTNATPTDRRFNAAAASMLVISFVGMVFQEAALGPQSATTAFVFAGAVSGSLPLAISGNQRTHDVEVRWKWRLAGRWRTIAAFSLIGGVFGFAYALSRPARHSAEVTIVPVSIARVTPAMEVASDASAFTNLHRIAAVARSRSVADVVIRECELQREWGLSSVDATRRKLWKDCTLTADLKEKLLSLRCETTNPELAPKLVLAFHRATEDTFARAFTRPLEDFERVIDDETTRIDKEIDRASLDLARMKSADGVVELDLQASELAQELSSLFVSLTSRRVELSYVRSFASGAASVVKQLEQQSMLLENEIRTLFDTKRPGFLRGSDVPRLRFEQETLEARMAAAERAMTAVDEQRDDVRREILLRRLPFQLLDEPSTASPVESNTLGLVWRGIVVGLCLALLAVGSSLWTSVKESRAENLK